jgi:hypothetical protein
VTRRKAFATLTAIAFGGWLGGIGAQAPADFSGRWTIEAAVAPAPPAPGAPAPALRPDQGTLNRGDMGSGWGSPLAITQDAKQLVVEQTLFSRYDANAQPRFVYLLDGTESRNSVMIGHATQVRTSRATWEGQALRIVSRYPAIDPGSGKPFTTEVAHRLSLESPTMMIIETTRAAALGGAETRTRTVYRKG